MIEVNFLGGRRIEGEYSTRTITQKEIDSQFDVSVNVELIEYLKKTSELEQQTTLNNIFDESRREVMLKKADKDRRGRSVVYYRSMSYESFLVLMKDGILDPIRYAENIAVEEMDIRRLLREISGMLLLKNDSEDFSAEQIKNVSLEDLFSSIFPTVNREKIEGLCLRKNLKELKEFFSSHLDIDLQKKIHTGGAWHHFIAFFSLSVGSPRTENVGGREVYVEMIAPTSSVILNPNSKLGEKEVLMRSLHRSGIIRAYRDKEQFDREVIENTESVHNVFYRQYTQFGHRVFTSPIDCWRFDANTEDYLPIGLVKKSA